MVEKLSRIQMQSLISIEVTIHVMCMKVQWNMVLFWAAKESDISDEDLSEVSLCKSVYSSLVFVKPINRWQSLFC